MEDPKNNEEPSSSCLEDSQSNDDLPHLNDIESLISLYKKSKKIHLMIFDIQTTGNFKNDHIIELAAMEMENFKLTGINFHIYIKPRVYIRKEITEKTNITQDFYQNYCENYYFNTKIQLQKLLEFMGNDYYLIGYNLGKNIKFLNSELKYWKLPQIPKERFRCTMAMMQKFFQDNNIKFEKVYLNNCCNYFKIKFSKNDGNTQNVTVRVLKISKLFLHIFMAYKGDIELKDENGNEYIPLINENEEKKIENKNNEIVGKLNGIDINKLIGGMNELIIQDKDEKNKIKNERDNKNKDAIEKNKTYNENNDD